MTTAGTAGLCGSCMNARVIESSKGGRFIRCELSFTDARFARYPRLPVATCEGFSATDGAARSLPLRRPEGSDDPTKS